MVRTPEARPRQGFTLTEVLMAMFVMAIGMISLLALFPAAFQQAKWALDNEQVARAAANAQSMTEMPHMQVTTVGGLPMLASGTMQSVRNDDLYRPETGNGNMLWRSIPPVTSGALGASRAVFLIDPTTGGWTFSTDLTANVPAGTRVKFPPVFVDPPVAASGTFIANGVPFHVGVDNSPPDTTYVPFGTRVVGGATARISVGIPRSSMSQFLTDTGAVKLRMQTEVSMGDEINFDTNGQPLLAAGQFARQRRFTWAYLCNWSDYKMSEYCEVSAVVFNSRPDFPGTFPAGETTYGGSAVVAAAAGTDTSGAGRVFVKGLTQATIALASPQPMNLKAGDWILDSTLILPDYDPTYPTEKLPFLDTFVTATVPFTSAAGTHNLRFGLAGGQFYKVLDVSEIRAVGTNYYQTITLDRPAKSDGFTATILSGIADVIPKSVGRMPQR